LRRPVGARPARRLARALPRTAAGRPSRRADLRQAASRPVRGGVLIRTAPSVQGEPRMRKTTLLAAAALLVGAAARIPASAQAVAVDKEIAPYKKTSGVSGNLNSIGSDTLNNVMTLWAEAFQKEYPNVKIQIEGKGSGTAPPALIAGTSQLGPMSRVLKPEELDAFEKQYGYKPTPIRVAVDGIGGFV